MRRARQVLGAILILSTAAVAACAPDATDARQRSMGDLVLLTRDGCADSTTMARNLNAALGALGVAPTFAVVDLDQLPSNDWRRAYPTPTILRGTRDLFGMPAPEPPYPSPT